MSRKKLIVGSALVFGLLLANTVHLAGVTKGNAKRGFVPVWSLPLRSVSSVVRTQVRAGEGPLLVLASANAVTLVGDDGKERRHLAAGSLTALATGDLSGDGVDEIVTLARNGADASVTALDGDLKALWSRPVAGGAEATRVLVVDLDGDRRRDVVVASSGGTLHAFGADGAPRWTWSMPDGPAGEDGQVRGLDDSKAGAERRVAVARRDGQVALIDGRGQPLWAEAQPAKVRRLRVIELGDGGSSLLIGREDGVCWRVRENKAGASAFRGDALAQLGEPVTEIRAVEVDGNDKTRELAVGGKNGRIVIVGAGSADVQAKISAMAGADVDGDGRDELLVGTETGVVHLLTAQGDYLAEIRGQGKVDALLSVPGNAGSRLLVLAAANGVSAQRYDVQDAPVWYHPATAALLGMLGLGGVTLALSRLRPVAIEPTAPAADLPAARRTQLEQAWKRVAALMEGGHAKPEDAQERLDQLRKQIEATDRQATRAARPLVSSPPPPKRK